MFKNFHNKRENEQVPTKKKRFWPFTLDNQILWWSLDDKTQLLGRIKNYAEAGCQFTLLHSVRMCTKSHFLAFGWIFSSQILCFAYRKFRTFRKTLHNRADWHQSIRKTMQIPWIEIFSLVKLFVPQFDVNAKYCIEIQYNFDASQRPTILGFWYEVSSKSKISMQFDIQVLQSGCYIFGSLKIDKFLLFGDNQIALDFFFKKIEALTFRHIRFIFYGSRLICFEHAKMHSHFRTILKRNSYFNWFISVPVNENDLVNNHSFIIEGR